MNATSVKMSTNKERLEKLYESENYLVVNKPYDMYINSDDENEKVFIKITAKLYHKRVYIFLVFGLSFISFCLLKSCYRFSRTSVVTES